MKEDISDTAAVFFFLYIFLSLFLPFHLNAVTAKMDTQENPHLRPDAAAFIGATFNFEGGRTISCPVPLRHGATHDPGKFQPLKNKNKKG